MASIQFMGRLVRDPEVKQVGTSEVCSFTVAVSTREKKADGSYEANFYDCSLWGERGKHLAERAHKGTEIMVIGDFYQKETTDPTSGMKRYRLRVDVDHYRLPSGQQVSAAAPAQEKEAPASDDIPF